MTPSLGSINLLEHLTELDICVYICATHYIYIKSSLWLLKGTDSDILVAVSSLNAQILPSKYPSSLKEQGHLEKMTDYKAK